jgi:Rrf2 family transcriptional repressor of oqxAB
LAEAKLIETSHGRDGGVRILRAADEITLREIYLAMVGTKCLWTSRDVPHQCLVSSNIKEYFAELTDKVQEAMLSVLGSKTLANSLSEIRAMHKHRQRAKSTVANGTNRIRRSPNKSSKGAVHV